MPRYEVSLRVLVPAFYNVEIEAASPEEAQAVALKHDKEMHKAGPNTYGSEWDVEWSEREDPEVNECNKQEEPDE